MDNAKITEILDTYPDKVAEALKKWKTAKIDLDRLEAKLYLTIRADHAGEKLPVREIEAIMKGSDEHYAAALAEVVAESEYTAAYETLLAAKRESNMRTAF